MRVVIDWKKELNQEQLAAVQHEGGPLLVLAGAGSGKTRALVFRVAWLVEQGVPAGNILLLTFTNKAAGEMKERVRKLVGVSPGFAGTFHSFCAWLLRRYGESVGLTRSFVIYDEGDKKQVIVKAIKELGLDPKVIKAKTVAAMISTGKNEMLNASVYRDLARGSFQKQVALIWQWYEKKMKESMAVDFDDLLLLGVKLLEKEDIREKVAGQFEYVLVDEYQDTNKAQYRLTKLLDNGRGNLTVVGDFSQSVYSWRGADFRNLSYLKKDYPNLTEVKLEKNYRSSQNILDAAYKVIERNTTHPVLKLQATKDRGEKVKSYEARDEKDEAAFVLGKITESRDYGKFAVLYRTNAQSRALEEAFVRSAVPYVLVGGVRFYERAEVKDVLALLKVVANPKDEVAWERIEKRGKRRRAAFEQWLEKTGEKIAKMKTEEIMEQALESGQYLKRYDPEDEEDLGRLENIKELASVAKDFPNLVDFLENVVLVQSEAQSKMEDGDRVTLMTMHAAKGLEFENVFVVGLEEGLFPHSRTLMDRDQLEEERRLFYVAMTRAENNLFLSHARNRLFFGQRNNSDPSRFLAEIPEYLIERENSKTPAFARRVPVDERVVGELVVSDFDEIDNW